MLNLSDKDLDRLSKEAAQEYEPGEILGPNSWEKLEIRLDSDLGRGSPNPLRHIRRFPFYYAPALLVLLGISYYYLTKHPPSSRYIVKNSITTQLPTNTSNSTPSANSSSNPSGPDATKSDAADSGTSSPGPGGATADANPINPAAGATPSGTVNRDGTRTSDAASPTDARISGSATRARTSATAAGSAPTSSSVTTPGASANTHNHLNHPSSRSGTRAPAPLAAYLASHSKANSSAYTTRQRHSPEPTTLPQTPSTNSTVAQTHELQWSRTGGLSAIKEPADISDSALRAFTARSTPPPLIKRSLYISRNWQFGLTAAPDFASVNSLAGDKPGSTIGITVDYQFAPRWYISSGLLLDRRNYAARNQDFHPSHSFYHDNSVDSTHLDFVKGSLQMLEIPLNLRYDFSVTGNTLFFASVGVSSYLLSSENGNCYVQWLNGVVPKNFNYPASGNYLFSSMNLSLGVETGLSNSLSMLIAPYLKMPLRPIGHGQLQMNSVGISFSLKWAPVTSRRRR